MNIEKTFLNLVEYLLPFNFENKIEKYLPKNIKKDQHGNYYLKIGDNDVMFTCHLDSYTKEYKKVNIIKDGNIYKTDGTSNLGADDKAGTTIMLYMIEHNIPGLYYFFRGEEGQLAPTGTWGSKQALKSYEEQFKKYKKCIAFDRKKKGSIITHMMWQDCCSDEFAESLSKEFKKHGMNYTGDDSGMITDSGIFSDIIPECTNLSVGYENEHTVRELQDIDYLVKLCETVVKIDWNSLPIKRNPAEVKILDTKYTNKNNSLWDDEWDEHNYRNYDYGNYSSNITNKTIKKTPRKGMINAKGEREYYTIKQMFNHVQDILDYEGYECINPEQIEDSLRMYFRNNTSGDFFSLKIVDFEIYITEPDQFDKFEKIGDIDQFESYVKIGGSYTDYEEEHPKEIENNFKEKSIEEEYTEPVNNINQLKIGTYVYHTKLGEGNINKISGTGDNILLDIFFFNENGVKVLSYKYSVQYLKLSNLPF